MPQLRAARDEAACDEAACDDAIRAIRESFSEYVVGAGGSGADN
jgi:hypothetical protein